MQNTTIASAVAANAGFHRIIARLTQLTARIVDRSMTADRAQRASQRARLEDIRGRLQARGAPAGSAGGLRDALGALATSLEDVAGDAAALVEDAVEFVGTMPGFFALMTRDEKRATLSHVLARPEVASGLRASLPGQGTEQTQHCAQIVSLEVIDAVLGLVLALATDVVAEAVTAGAATPVIVAVAIVELVMFALAIAVAVLSYQDCVG
jgi:hypothetical protein